MIFLEASAHAGIIFSENLRARSISKNWK